MALTASGLVASAAATPEPAAALTASRAAVTVTITATSKHAKITGDVLVAFKGRKGTNVATISGTVSDATAGEVARLYAQPFPFKSKPVPLPGKKQTLSGRATQSYKFTARPSVATRYTVRVLPGSATTSPAAAASRLRIVYVITNQVATGGVKCGRPVCHESLRVTTRLPASAYKTEADKKWHFYLGVNLNRIREPGPPKYLVLKSATISKARKISATEFERTITFSFRIGDDGYNWLADYCSRNTESTDGINLPGHHKCGVREIRNSTRYLG